MATRMGNVSFLPAWDRSGLRCIQDSCNEPVVYGFWSADRNKRWESCADHVKDVLSKMREHTLR